MEILENGYKCFFSSEFNPALNSCIKLFDTFKSEIWVNEMKEYVKSVCEKKSFLLGNIGIKGKKYIQRDFFLCQLLIYVTRTLKLWNLVACKNDFLPGHILLLLIIKANWW